MTEILLPDGGGDELAPRIRISRFKVRVVEPIGRWFEAYMLRQHRLTNSISDESTANVLSEKPLETEGLVIEDDVEYLRKLDPRKWKDQDHYAVLGLKSLRYRATEEDIRKAYRQKVLRHHPDKRMAAGEKVNRDEDYFVCITRAFEILGTQAKRISYDSVDPDFDDDTPSQSPSSKAKFFEVFGPVFERNARWSTIEPVPGLGDVDSPREVVEAFYTFWYDFESWREFSYLDEEEKEKGQDREERRWIEKQNRVARKSRRKEEIARIRELVDNAYNCDPRIIRFREEEKERKAGEKRARQEAIRLKKEKEEQERLAAEAEEKRLKEEAEAIEKARADIEKKEREQQKKSLKKERKVLRTLCKEKNYFTESDGDRVQAMEEVERLCEGLDLLRLKELNEALGTSRAKEAFEEQVAYMRSKLEIEKEETIGNYMRTNGTASGARDGDKSDKWSHEDLQLLIKAVNLFPAGTSQRWEVVANFVNQHTKTDIKRIAKDVLSRAKILGSGEASNLKTAVNQQAFSKFEQSYKPAPVSSDVSVRNDEVTAEAGEVESIGGDKSWSTEEQKLLEQALRTYPASAEDRWGKIASCVPGRTKKECMKRFKELAEMVKAKKAAAALPAKKKT
ncbi:unnamed protein product [Notodromas monacha]|uniref:DnaJ homolog subfamily C member 2 n=1 Tax=Notodromas monacha TaxID=399045 RepID=A0A7R9GD13_9CRUS|nr:unnamed protein product [Notodromas monacha]CAG0918053.1 unnamed protein product [Notodromas monacha]